MVECKGCHPKKLTGLTQTAVVRAGRVSARLGKPRLTGRPLRAHFAVSARERPVPILRFALSPRRPAPIADRGSPEAAASAPRPRRIPVRSWAAMAIRSEGFRGRNRPAPRIRFMFPMPPLPVITSLDRQENTIAPRGPGSSRLPCRAPSRRHGAREDARRDRPTGIRGTDNKWIFVKTHQRSIVI